MRTPLLLLLATAPLASQIAPPIDPALRARFGFVGPKIHKIGWGLGLLQVARLDPDSPAVALVNNARRARLEVLRFDGDELAIETESTRGVLQGLAVADVDGDGTPDLMTLSGRGRLHTTLRGPGAATVAPIEVGTPASDNALRAADLDGDGRADAVVLGRNGLLWVTRIASQPVVSAAEPLLANQVEALHLFDADGDGNLDIVVGTNDASMRLRIRRGTGAGTFGPWIALDVDAMRNVFPGTGVGGRPTLATIEGRHGRVVEYVLQRREVPGQTAVALTALPETRRTMRAFAQGDVDGDGDSDIVLADPERARLLFLLESGGAFELRTAPSLSGVDALAVTDVDRDGVLDVLLCSAEEHALAYKSGAAPLGAFPTRLPAADGPMAAATVGDAVLFLARDERRNAALWRLARDGSDWAKPAKVVDLGRLADGPLRLLVADFDGAVGPDVAYVQPGLGLRVLFAQDGGGFAPPAGGERGPASIKLDDGAVSVAEGAAGPALLAVQPRFTRLLRFDASGQPTVLEQDNGPEGIGEISLSCTLPDSGRAYLDNAAGKLWITRPGSAAQSIDVPKLGATHLLAHEDALVLLAKAAVVRVPLRGPSWQLTPLRSHEPPTDKTRYYAGLAADFDGDGRNELVVADDEIHGLHILAADDDTLRRALSFPVFELPEAQDGNNEPRGYCAGDLNGDGRTDLVLMCHDRILIYLQEN